MADGDELPDGDYESIYGPEALAARTLTRLDTLRKKLEEQKEVLTRLNEQGKIQQ